MRFGLRDIPTCSGIIICEAGIAYLVAITPLEIRGVSIFLFGLLQGEKKGRSKKLGEPGCPYNLAVPYDGLRLSGIPTSSKNGILWLETAMEKHYEALYVRWVLELG